MNGALNVSLLADHLPPDAIVSDRFGNLAIELAGVTFHAGNLEPTSKGCLPVYGLISKHLAGTINTIQICAWRRLPDGCVHASFGRCF